MQFLKKFKILIINSNKKMKKNEKKNLSQTW